MKTRVAVTVALASLLIEELGRKLLQKTENELKQLM